MRPIVSLPALLLALTIPALAHADGIFHLQGTLQDGGTASGTFFTDNQGYISQLNVAVHDQATTYNFVGPFYEGPYLGPGNVPISFYATSYDQASDNLLLSFPALFAGVQPTFCTTTAPCPGFISSFTPVVNFSSGKAIDFTTLTASTVPEPASLSLLLTGLVGSLAAIRRRFR